MNSYAVDLETTTVGKALDPRVDRLDIIQVYDGRGPVVIVPNPKHLGGAAHLITHNGMHDLPHMMRKGLDIMQCRLDDTMDMAYLLGEPTLALKLLARRHLGVYATEYGEGHEEGADFWNYSAQDAVLTWDLAKVLAPRLGGAKWLYETVRMPLQRILARSTLMGLKLDQHRLLALHAKVEGRHDRLEQALVSATGIPDFNLRSPVQVAHYLFDVLGLPEDPHDGRSTGEKVVGKYRDRCEWLRMLLTYRACQSLMSRYTVPLQAMDYVTTLWSTTTADTGRLASKSRNMQNFPLVVKQCCVARDGMKFVYGDYSQQELRLAYFFSRDPYLGQVLLEGRDMHTDRAMDTYGVVTVENRTRAKSANFAALFLGGAAIQAATLQVPVSVVEARPLRAAKYFEWAEHQGRQPYVETVYGHRFYIEEHDSNDPRLRDKALKKAANSPIQGSGGNMTQYAQVLAEPLFQDLGGYVIHQEHDSVLCEVPEAIPDAEAKAALAQAMHEAVHPDVLKVIDIPAKITVGKYWG